MEHAENLLKTVRHSTAHLLAHAVYELFPHTIMTIGPATKDGFFYDFLPAHNFKEDDLTTITTRMREIAARNLTIEHFQMPKDEARVLFAHNRFKLELIDDIPGDTVGIARQGNFVDLCKGDHVASTGSLTNFKLLAISGSYWRADRSNQVLQRITGTAFPTAQELTTYEQRIHDAQQYDHRTLGRELDLFSFHNEAPGFPFFHPRGQKIITTMYQYLRNELHRFGYDEVATPQILSAELWKQSGHYAHYKDNMYFCTIDDLPFAIKPMNCPGAILLFNERPRSYRELPLRLAEFGKVHRHELSGALHGLFRVRSFTQDDGHIFCTREQIGAEVRSVIQMVYRVFKQFDFNNIAVHVSTRPAKAMGNDELWNVATDALKNALDAESIMYTLSEGDGAFYGPKIDFHIKDSMDRTWQCGTIQLDFCQPDNFDLGYITPQGTRERPVMIHRAIFGSFERFFGIMLEHYKGKLPFWLAPVPVAILTITDAQMPYAQELHKKIDQLGINAQLDQTSDPLAGKIKRAQLQQIPWMIIMGNKEMAQGTYTIRYLDGKQEMGVTQEQLLERIKNELGKINAQ